MDEHERQERETDETRDTGRGGSASAISAALSRTITSGPSHWGGKRPPRSTPTTPLPDTPSITNGA
ncbi:calcium-binding protein [Nocardiopsis alba]|uniref:calcium-binding protein n=1 Tax=Nocardiopsis alba TaxID=53437 RepID=UPI003672184C